MFGLAELALGCLVFSAIASVSFPLKTGPSHWAPRGDIEWRGNDILTKTF
jgi:hypothetical protein